MDRQLAERMVGAACLLAVLVLVVPAILDGNPDSGATITHPAVEEAIDLRTHTIRLDGAEREPPVPTAVQGRPSRELPVPAPPEPAAPAGEPPVVEEAGGMVLPDSEPTPVAAAPAGSPATEPVVTSPESLAQAAGAASGDWLVQLGSFSKRENAERLAADLKRKGFSVSVQGGGGSSGTLFRVRAGPEPDKASAEALAARLAAAGFKGGRVGRK
ncbi:MAG: SPOR domain-containing protein [Gammaproteobacteria bacterium]